MSKECLRTGDKALIHFRFKKHPEYMVPGQRMVFREGRTKAVGNVVRIFTQSTNVVMGNKVKPTKRQRLSAGSQRSPMIAAPQNNLQEVGWSGSFENVGLIGDVCSLWKSRT